MKIASKLSSYHRIPGSQGYLTATSFIKSFLDEKEGELAEKALGDTVYLTRSRGWNPISGWLRVRDSTWEFRGVPTLIAAYSPSSDGVVRGNVSLVDDGVECRIDPGSIVVTSLYPSLLYLKCRDELKNAAGVIVYVEDRRKTPTGFPYVRVDLGYWRTIGLPVVTASQVIADRLKKKGGPVELYVETDSQSRETPIVKYSLPGKDDEEIVVVAHICHPKPGANDNASGSSVVLHLAKYFSAKNREGWTPRMGLTFLWVPEYLGTFYSLETGFIDPKKTLFAINLDMVGGDPRFNGGTLSFVESSPSSPGIYEAVVYNFLEETVYRNKSFSGLNRLPYIAFNPYSRFEIGSDHDVFASYGVEAVMVNQWPDRFYHTHEDSPEKLSPAILESVALATRDSIEFLAGLNAAKAEELSKFLWKRFLLILSRQASLPNPRMGVSYLKERISLINENLKISDSSLRLFVAENLERMRSFIESLEKLYPLENFECCINIERPEVRMPPYPLEKSIRSLTYREMSLYMNHSTLVIEFYRLVSRGMDPCQAELVLRSYYVFRRDKLCAIKDLIVKLVKMNSRQQRLVEDG